MSRAKSLRCYWCLGHGLVLADGVKKTCPECGGCGLDADVIRERQEERRKQDDDRDFARERDHRSGAYGG